MNYTLNSKSYLLTIGWLYPDLMSTYGDRGNILVLQKRCDWRNIETKIIPISPETTSRELHTIDLIFGGGAQDREQEIVIRDLHASKGKIIKELIERYIPALFVCGSPQIMGNYYEPAEGKKLEGLGIFDMETINPGPNAQRLIGNIVAEVNWENLLTPNSRFPASPAGRQTPNSKIIVGFENHGGRTHLGPKAKPFAKVIKGFGNNGDDQTEGVVYKNALGCYFHGPLLPKNPIIADWLIKTALEIKYQKPFELKKLDDSLEEKAKKTIAKRLGVSI